MPSKLRVNYAKGLNRVILRPQAEESILGSLLAGSDALLVQDNALLRAGARLSNILAWFKSFLALILCSCFLSACTTVYNSATQRNETLLFNTTQEVALGKDLDAQMSKDIKVSQDPALQARLERIGRQVVLSSDRRDLAYNFRVAQDDELNAFALPGGFIYVNSGLINQATDDELAGVIAHETGHIAARHSVKKLQATLGYQFIMSVIVGLSGKQQLGDVLNVVYNYIGLGYSRQDEFLADTLAVRYSRRAGYNPRGIVDFFNKLKADAEQKGRGSVPVFFSSHPKIEDRIANVEREINANVIADHTS